jgi:hypothetical protein
MLLFRDKILFKFFLKIKISCKKIYDVIHCRNVIKYIKLIIIYEPNIQN